MKPWDPRFPLNQISLWEKYSVIHEQEQVCFSKI